MIIPAFEEVSGFKSEVYYYQQKEYYALLLRTRLISRPQYESLLKAWIKAHLKHADSLFSRRVRWGSSVAARQYRRFINQAQGREGALLYWNSKNYKNYGGTREMWLDSLVTKRREPLVWADEC